MADAETCAVSVLLITLFPTTALTAAPPDAARLRPMERICDVSSACKVTFPAAVASEPPEMAAETALAMSFPKPVALTATTPDAPIPAVKEAIPARESASSTMSPPVEVTLEPTIPASTVLVITLPVKAPPTATPPVPATLTMSDRMLALGSTGEPARASFKASRVFESRM